MRSASDIDIAVSAYTRLMDRTRHEFVAGKMTEIVFKLRRHRQDKAFDGRFDLLMKRRFPSYLPVSSDRIAPVKGASLVHNHGAAE
ncbi:hypothetical protein [Neorhizobium sp. LjRoot104]|uniref:hypothetical protein n=1 Tax=Neorhizobium sp. LjRoot104 TaxID=3342254 RepID=UPI003ECE1867